MYPFIGLMEEVRKNVILVMPKVDVFFDYRLDCIEG